MPTNFDKPSGRPALFELYYWPGLPGRGEFPRLVLEATRTPYRDVARLPPEDGGGIDAMMACLAAKGRRKAFAPPFLVHGGAVVSQSSVVAAYLGEHLGLAPADEADRWFARSLAQTTADVVDEAHEVHHPLGTDLYYEDQLPEAKRRAEGFRASRMPKFLRWYEDIIQANESGWLLGERMSYVDLGLFQLVEGLRYAFPKRMAALAPDFPNVVDVAARVRADPAVADYLASDRRLAFNEDGIFRNYPELDADA